MMAGYVQCSLKYHEHPSKPETPTPTHPQQHTHICQARLHTPGQEQCQHSMLLLSMLLRSSTSPSQLAAHLLGA
jgi:hypothetical protein